MLPVLATLLVAPALQQELTFESLSVTVDVSAFEDFGGEVFDRGHWRGQWSGSLDGHQLEVNVTALDRKNFRGLLDAADVANVYSFNAGNAARREGRSAGFRFDVTRPIPGPLSELPFGWFAAAGRYEGTKQVGTDAVVCGLTPDFGYMLEIVSAEPLDDAGLAAIETWAAKSVEFTGPKRDPRWTDEEAEERFWRDAPKAITEKLKKRKKKPTIARTEHYIIFTDIGKGTLKGFSKALEENYDQIQSVFPFIEVEGERLMPVFYFVNREHYIDWWVETLANGDESRRASAERSGGVASGDVYSTYHQAPKATVHIHEQTHQIFRNRLRLGGGGSWFQEGVAEYMSSKPAELGAIKRLSQKEGELVPFEEFMVVPSLLMSSKKGARKDGTSNSGLAYTYAASIIEFTKHSKFGEERFLEWVHAIGKVGRGDLPAIKAATSRVYGVGLPEFEEEFRKYWGKRRSVKGWHSPG